MAENIYDSVCPECGRYVSEEDNYCSHCGHELKMDVEWLVETNWKPNKE